MKDQVKTFLVYIAGPYTPVMHDVNGQPMPHFPVAYNVRLAAETAHEVVAKMAPAFVYPVTPHMNTAFFEETHIDPPAEYWLAGTKELMLKCDAVILINHPALDTSRGTRQEVISALSAGIPVYTSVDEAVKHFVFHPDSGWSFDQPEFDEDIIATNHKADDLIRRAKGSDA